MTKLYTKSLSNAKIFINNQRVPKCPVGDQLSKLWDSHVATKNGKFLMNEDMLMHMHI